MNRTFSILAILAAAVLPFVASVQSQTAAAAPKSTLQQLQEMKEKNKATMEKQEALLLKLEDLNKEATQIKLLTKRG
jgi:hypothetical protein